MDDRALVNRFLKHRTSLNFSAIFSRHGQTLMRVAIYLCRNQKEIAEDLVQETWIAAIAKLGSFEWRSSLKTWLTGILINKYRDHQRKDMKHEEISSAYEKGNMVGQDLRMDMKNAILKLPMGYREILTLHDIEGFKHQEIAELLEINEGTSKSQLFHARKAMRKILTEYKTK
ncbi:MAG: RNA polymerase sigma factor [Saprospiraceae bacterium]|nr:RNA polymerase sigma factor [Saprospiraceae bacterium]